MARKERDGVMDIVAAPHSGSKVSHMYGIHTAGLRAGSIFYSPGFYALVWDGTVMLY